MTLRTVSFTASRDMDQAAREGVVTSVLTVHVPHADRYLTGACTGGDAFIGRWLYANRPDAEHVVIVPASRSRVDPWWLEAKGPAVTVTEMPPGTTYADRNAALVAEAGAVFAFPSYPENDPRSVRSGTWQTARMARKVGNFSQWHCVRPPYRGLIERYPMELPGMQGPRPVRVPVDLNERDRQGRSIGRLAGASGPVAAGDKVLVVEPADGIIGDAVVTDVSEERGLVRLDVDWHSFRDDPEAADDPSCE